MTTRQPTIADAINWDHAAEFSYASHVTHGIDYVCLFRSTALTIKAYLIDAGSKDDIVVPHNHRYDFESRVIRGALSETQFAEDPAGLPYNRYDYECIMDGGRGFVFAAESKLLRLSQRRYVAGSSYCVFSNLAHRDIHTLTRIEPGTIVLQTQYADVGPSWTLAWAREIPDTSEAYRKMDPHELRRRVDELQEAMRP